jgi:FKBP-type peptidyl-prolyl cis-trans isomerase FkpA
MIQIQNMVTKFLFAILIIASFSGCIKSTGTKCTYDNCLIKAPASEIQAVQNYLTSQNITNAVQHCSGLFYIIDNPGTGKSPNACSAIDVTYTGSLTNGTVFDSGNFQSGLGSLIIGWRNGIPLIKAVGKIRLFIPPSLGYGAQANGTIPANSILIFSIDLNAVE